MIEFAWINSGDVSAFMKLRRFLYGLMELWIWVGLLVGWMCGWMDGLMDGLGKWRREWGERHICKHIYACTLVIVN